MAGLSYFTWIPLLLSCVFQASDNRYGKEQYANHTVVSAANNV